MPAYRLTEDNVMSTIDTINRMLEHSPAKPQIEPPKDLLGFDIVLNGAEDSVFICATCSGRLNERGCMGAFQSLPVWADEAVTEHVCKACGDH